MPSAARLPVAYVAIFTCYTLAKLCANLPLLAAAATLINIAHDRTASQWLCWQTICYFLQRCKWLLLLLQLLKASVGKVCAPWCAFRASQMPSALTETQQLNNNGEGFFLFSVTKSRTKGIDELLIRFSCRAARKCFLSVGKKCNNGSSRTMQRYWRRFFSLGGRLRLPMDLVFGFFSMTTLIWRRPQQPVAIVAFQHGGTRLRSKAIHRLSKCISHQMQRVHSAGLRRRIDFLLTILHK